MKRLLLMFGMVSCWISTHAQYTQTTPLNCTAALQDTLYDTMTQVPAPAGGGTITFYFKGDLDGGPGAASPEAYWLYDENNNLIGTSVSTTSQCNTILETVTFQIPVATLGLWAADGSIDFKVYSGAGINPTLCAAGSCVQIELSYPPVTGPNDAGVLSVDSPQVFCPGTESIYATIGNAGTNQITSLQVNWSFNGTVQTPISYTSTLDTLGGTGSNLAQILLGSKNFVANTSYDIKVWTSSPNGVADTSNINDTSEVSVQPSLSGTYTINDALPTSGSNFNNFSDAFNTFAASGVCGPVVLNVSGGPYYEQFTVTNVSGSSSVNTITVNGNGASIIDSSGAGNYAVVLLDGADYVTIDSLDIRKYGSSGSVGVQFMNAADNNIIRNCTIEVDEATSSTVIPVTFSGSATSSTTAGDNGNNNLLEGNTIRGGYYGIRHYGTNTTTRLVGNQFIGNTVENFYYYGIYNYYAEGTKIVDNDINRMTRNSVSTGAAIYCYYVSENVEISGNWIHHLFQQATGSTSTMYGIYLSACDNSAGNNGTIANNLMTDNDNGGTHYDLYNSSSDRWNYYHNTIVEDDPNAPVTSTFSYTYGFYLSGATDVDFRNNLIFMNRGGVGPVYNVYISSPTNFTMDNNAYFAPLAGTVSNINFGYYSGDVASFTAWQAVNSGAFDQASAEGDPFFVDPANGDYAPSAAYFNDIGANLLTAVPTDFTGAARSTTPDPGAFEFTPPPGPDMSVANIYDGGASCGTSTDIIVEVLNQGTDTVNSFTVNYTINGVAQTAISVTGVYATGKYDSISITGIPISGASITNVVISLSNVAPGTDTDPGNDQDSIQLRAGLSGIYTIDGGAAASATNFISFTALAQGLEQYGVCGNVTVNVANSAVPYSERFFVNEVSGVSATSTVTINGNGNTLEYLSTNSAERATVILNGADWITIDSLNITALGSTTSEYGFGVSMSNNADHNTLSNCVITVADDVSSSNYAGVTISGSLGSATSGGVAGDHNRIEGNTISGGYYGVTSYGQSTDSLTGNMIVDNEVSDFYYYGVYSYYNRDLLIDGNDIHRLNRATVSSFYGVYAYYTEGGKVVNNRIHDGFANDPTSTSTAYGIYTYQLSGTASDSAVIGNNMIYNIDHDGYIYALYPNSVSFTQVIHNTVVIDDAVNTTTSTFYTTAALYAPSAISSSTIANNLFYVDRDNPGSIYLAYLGTSGASGSVLDRNAYYNPGNFPASFGYAGGSAIATFSAWKSTTGADANSVNQDPYFVNLAGGNFMPQSAVMDGAGFDFSGTLAADINGVARGASPDLGAIEFIGAPCTGLSQINAVNIGATSGTVVWNPNPSTVTIEWGPVGFKQASIVGTIINVPTGDTSSVISGLGSNKCYDYYLTMNCTSSIPGAPPLMGPYTFCTDCANGPLNGTYTVGGTPSATNFPTLDSVVTALNGCGINGPVVFNMNGGTHNAISLGLIDGSSATNTITFNGAAGFGDSIVALSQSAAVDLDGTSYITFNDIYMENGGGNFVVWMHNGTRGINLMDCELIGSPTTTTFSTAVVAATGTATSATSYGDNVSGLTVSGCRIVGNYYGMAINGSSTSSKSPDINIVDNTIEDAYYYGIRTYYCDSTTIEGNMMPNGFRNTSSYGIYTYYTDNASVRGNAIYGAGYAALMFYYSNYSNATPGSHSIVANNMLQCTGNYGLYLYYPVDVDVFHNSIQAGSLYGMYLSGSATATENVDVRNNIIEMSGSGTALYVATAPLNTNIDYNLYSSGGDIGNGYATLAAWQAADTSWNQNSVVDIPGFTSSSDFHIVGTAPNDIGDNSVGITTDIDGDPRPASGSSIVDIGADEFTPLNSDAAILDVLSPNGCGSTSTQLSLVFQNLGLDTIFSATATITVSGSQTSVLTANYTGALASLEQDTIIVGNINTFFGANIMLDGEITLSNDQDGTNDTLTVGPKEYIPEEPLFYTPDTVCVNQDTATFAAIPYGGVQYGWYANSVDTVPVAVGDSFDFPISGQRTWYLGYMNNADSLITTYAAGNGQSGNMFDINALNAVSIQGFSVNPQAAGSITVEIHHKLGTYVGSESNASAWTLLGTFNVTSAGAGVPTYVGLTAPLQLSGGINAFYITVTTGSLNYTNGGTLGSVYASNNDIEFFEGIGIAYPFGGTFSPRIWNGTIHYGSVGCSNVKKTLTLQTGNDTAVAAFTSAGTDPSFTFDGSSSTNADGYVWNFGDGSPLDSGVAVGHTYTKDSTYTVVLCVFDTTGCLSTSCDTMQITVDSAGIGIEENLLSRSLVLYPNPSTGLINVSFTTADSEAATIVVTDLSGREMIRITKDAMNGKFEDALDISKLADGTYMLKISNSEMRAVRRIVKQ